jgi:hypothetical protein
MTLYKFNKDIDMTQLKLMKELQTANRHGIKYFIIGDLSEKVTGFKRGEQISSIIASLNKLKESNVRILIKNTYENIDFYKIILNKVPGIGFSFDKGNALKYSTNTIEEWLEFTDSVNDFAQV